MTADPRTQQYFLRMDTKTVVQSQQEYDECQKHHVFMRIVSYNSMVDHLNKEEAAQRKMAKRRAAGKLARKMRKQNARNRRG